MANPNAVKSPTSIDTKIKDEQARIQSAEQNGQTPAHLNFMGGASYFLSDPVNLLRLAAASSFFGEPQYYRETEKEQAAGGRKSKRINARTEGGIGYHALGGSELKRLRDVLDAVDPMEWRGLSPAKVMEQAIDAALDFDAERTLELAAELRNTWLIRTTPQIIMVRAANHPKVKGTSLISRYAKSIIKRMDEPAVQLAYQLATYGADKPIPNALKRAWSKAIADAKPYHLAKYRQENRTVSLVDVMMLCGHERRANALVKGEG